MNIKLIPLLAAIVLAFLIHHLITDPSLHMDYVGFGLLLVPVLGLCLVRAFEPMLDALAQRLL